MEHTRELAHSPGHGKHRDRAALRTVCPLLAGSAAKSVRPFARPPRKTAAGEVFCMEFARQPIINCAAACRPEALSKVLRHKGSSEELPGRLSPHWMLHRGAWRRKAMQQAPLLEDLPHQVRDGRKRPQTLHCKPFGFPPSPFCVNL